jgi:tRNA(Arg) A34 adenosine deaminase TadA
MHAPSAFIIKIGLPDWAEEYARGVAVMPDTAARMRFVIGAARANIEQGTGGPFAAAVFERDSGKFVALGVNLVARLGVSMLHAEIVALAFAQKKIGSYDLGAAELPAHELVSSAEPCAMCLGAIPWSGVKRLVAGARCDDVEKAGFDEGAKPEGWIGAFARRGIDVVSDVERAAAAKVIADYAKQGGIIYNPVTSRL